MSVVFSLTEAYRGMVKARLATVLSISSITLAILLIGLFAFFSVNLEDWVHGIREKIEIEVFVEPSATESEIKIIQEKLTQIEGIDSFEYIDKESAAERFNSEFGENVYDVLEYNPFPSSFTISLQEEYRTTFHVQKIKNNLEKIPHVDEAVYKKPLLEAIDKYLEIIYLIALAVGIIIIIIAIALIHNTVRLTIYARRDIIYIMRLVGAKNSFVKRPFLIEGLLQGLIGSIIASLFLYYLIKIVKELIYPYLVYDYRIFLILIAFGLIIGFFSAALSVGKYLRIT